MGGGGVEGDRGGPTPGVSWYARSLSLGLLSHGRLSRARFENTALAFLLCPCLRGVGRVVRAWQARPWWGGWALGPRVYARAAGVVKLRSKWLGAATKASPSSTVYGLGRLARRAG